MSRLVRRAFSTYTPTLNSKPGSSTLPPSAGSVASTLPLAVRRRRLERTPNPRASPSPLSDPEFHTGEPTTKRLPLAMELDFQKYRSKGKFPGDETAARALFLKAQMTYRSRIRGVRWKKSTLFDMVEAEERGEEWLSPRRKFLNAQLSDREAEQPEFEGDDEGPDGTRSGEIVAQRIYLPNIQIRLMRNHTPPGEAYDPHIATFRIPPSMTKTDLRSYLKAVYDLDITFIRTDLHWGEVIRDRSHGGRVIRQRGGEHNYKRAIVGLNEPFHYPDDVEELRAMGRETGAGDKYADDWKSKLDKLYFLTENENKRKKDYLEVIKKTRRYRSESSNAGATIRAIMEKRREREGKIVMAAKEIRDERLKRALGSEREEAQAA